MEDARHEQFMSLALRLARRAQGQTSPNPMVGAVIVRNGRVVGTGYHRRAGSPHAEVEALRNARRRAKGATLYVTLEPCNHYGRTPPCCDAIITAGVSRVVMASRDPNPLTNGRGIQRLRRGGIRVTTGVLESQAQALNAPFHKAMTSHLPWAVAKIGQSLDGKIATRMGESRWVTSPAARRIAHQWRSRVDAILVGINTVLRDDPALTVRGVPRRRTDRPFRVILDSQLRIPPNAQCVSSASPLPTLIATTVRRDAKRKTLERHGAEVLVFPSRHGRVPLRLLFQALVDRGIHSVLIEGGGEVLASAVEERLVDRLLCFIAPVVIGGRQAPSAVGGSGIEHLAQAVQLKDMTVRRVGPDLCVEARIVYPKSGNRRRGAGDRQRRRHSLTVHPTPRIPQLVS